jgi:hypothetical protein
MSRWVGRIAAVLLYVVAAIAAYLAVVGTYGMTEMYGPGGWLRALGFGALMGTVAAACVWAATRLLGRERGLLGLALGTFCLVTVGAVVADWAGGRANAEWNQAMASACVDPIGPAVTALGHELGQVIPTNSVEAWGDSDGFCKVWVGIDDATDVSAAVGAGAQAQGWTPAGEDVWQIDGVTVTYTSDPPEKGSTQVIVGLAARAA